MPDQQLEQIIQRGIAQGLSDDDIRLVAQEYQRRQAEQPAPTPAAWSALGNPAYADAMAQNFTDAAHDAGAKLLQTAYGGGDLLRRGWNAIAPGVMQVERPITKPEVQEAMRPTGSPAGKIGSTLFDAILYGRGGALGAGVKSTAGRAAAQAASAGAIGAAQEDELSGGVVPAVVAGTAPIVGAGIRAAGRVLRDKVAPTLVQAAIKPTVTALKTQAGASREGLQMQASRATKTLLDNQWTTRQQADAAARAAEADVQAALAGPSPNTVSPVLDLPARIPAYLAEREKRAAVQIGGDYVDDFKAAGDKLFAKSPLAQTTSRTVMQPPSMGAQMAGNTAPVPAQQTQRAWRAGVTPKEGLEHARGTAQHATKRAYGELKGPELEAEKTVERAVRDSVKDAVPAVKAPLARQADAMRVRDILDRMGLRDANRDVANPLTTMTTRSLIGQLIKSQQLRGGYTAYNLGQQLTGASPVGRAVSPSILALLAAAEDDGR